MNLFIVEKIENVMERMCSHFSLVFPYLTFSYVVIDSDSDDEYFPEKDGSKDSKSGRGKYTTNLEKQLSSASSSHTSIAG